MAGRPSAVDGHDPAQVAAALSMAMRSKKPTLIACKTIIGFGAPTKAGTAATHGAPLGTAEAQGAKAALGWNHAAVRGAGGHRRAMARRRRQRCRAAPVLAEAPGPPPAARRVRARHRRPAAGRFPRGGRGAEAPRSPSTKPKIATRQSSQKVLEALVPAIPELVGGSADLTGSNLTFVKGMGSVDRRATMPAATSISASASTAWPRA